MRNSTWSFFGVLVVLSIFSIFGWVWNIVKLVDTDFALNTGIFIVRAIGIFVGPLGAVLGYL